MDFIKVFNVSQHIVIANNSFLGILTRSNFSIFDSFFEIADFINKY